MSIHSLWVQHRPCVAQALGGEHGSLDRSGGRMPSRKRWISQP
jgi:hypothetical protein